MSNAEHIEIREEREYLEYVLSYLKIFMESAGKSKKEIDVRVAEALKRYNSDNVDQFTELTFNTLNQTYLGKKLKEAERAVKNPYFARIDFVPKDTGKSQKLYIGKMSLMEDETNDMLITDWRAPISTLYYEGRLGESSYQCADGLITGELKLKRQYEIEDGRLINVTDTDITTNDTFLKAALRASKDKRLKDIVTTIQAEQNKVIRAEPFCNLVVQGAAGGGKTTIALHRIAYLLYAYQESISPAQIMIMAPSNFFISYISDVLPDLGVDDISQSTFEDFVLSYIKFPKNTKINMIGHTEVLAQAVETGEYSSPSIESSGIKSSLKFKDLIVTYGDFILTRILPKEDFIAEGFLIMDASRIKTLFLNDYSYMPAERRLKKLFNVLEFQLKSKRGDILKFIEDSYDNKKEKLKKRMPDGDERRRLITELLDQRDEKMKSFKKNNRKALKDYMSKCTLLTPYLYYQTLFTKRVLIDTIGKNILEQYEIDLITEESIKLFKEKKLSTDDLAPILYLQFVLYGTEGLADIKQLVIDEGQDFSLFQIWVLQAVMKDAYFSVLGDLSQGIYSYKGIKQWQDVLSVYEGFERRSSFEVLYQSYRTTVEIMNRANEIIARLDEELPAARPVLRHGEPVITEKIESYGEMAEKIDKLIDDMNNKTESKNYKSMAIIVKTAKEQEEIRKMLRHKVTVITGKETEFTGGVMILPVYLAKGLEFDSVCIADESKYGDNPTDIKLLYIAVTRALHSLSVFTME